MQLTRWDHWVHWGRAAPSVPAQAPSQAPDSVSGQQAPDSVSGQRAPDRALQPQAPSNTSPVRAAAWFAEPEAADPSARSARSAAG